VTGRVQESVKGKSPNVDEVLVGPITEGIRDKSYTRFTREARACVCQGDRLVSNMHSACTKDNACLLYLTRWNPPRVVLQL
jgi:hypothetical protein